MKRQTTLKPNKVDGALPFTAASNRRSLLTKTDVTDRRERVASTGLWWDDVQPKDASRRTTSPVRLFTLVHEVLNRKRCWMIMWFTVRAGTSEVSSHHTSSLWTALVVTKEKAAWTVRQRRHLCGNSRDTHTKKKKKNSSKCLFPSVLWHSSNEVSL